MTDMIVLEHRSRAGLQRDSALLVDRDGTVIEDVPTYVRRPEDIRLLPAVARAGPLVAALGVPVALVSNQAGIGRGLVTGQDALQLQAHVVERLAAVGFVVHLSVPCLHAPEDESL